MTAAWFARLPEVAGRGRRFRDSQVPSLRRVIVGIFWSGFVSVSQEVEVMILLRLSLVFVMTLTLGACGKANNSVDSSSDDGVMSTGSPAEEGTGPEAPRPTEDEKSVKLPELPVGGGTSGEPEAQCVTASFTATLPDGVSVEVTNVRPSAGGVSVRGKSGCDGHDACMGFVFTSPNSPCAVLVDASGASAAGVDLLLDGKCLAEDLSACDDLRGRHGSVSLTVPPAPESSEDTTTTDETSMTDETSTSTTE
jgi:hypothetical protein